jgi:transcriptional regulator with XRE-family HTH domain
VEAVTAMSYSHAEKLARSAAGPVPAACPLPVDPRLYDSPEMRAILGERDIGGLFRAVKATGVSYRTIAALVGMSQSEVSEIISGRRVHSYDVLVRIAEGLGIPRELMGLAYTDGPPRSGYGGDDGAAASEVDEAMQRRTFVTGAAGIVLSTWGAGYAGDRVPFPTDVPSVPTPLPTKLSASDVAALETLIARTRSFARAWGGQADTVRETVNRSMRLLTVPASESLRRRLKIALSEFHMVAGWCCFDSGADDAARYHYSRSMELARAADDAYSLAYTLRLASSLPGERGYPDDALTLLRLGQLALDTATNDARQGAFIAGWLRAEAGFEFSRMGRATEARREMAAARNGWESSDPDEIADVNATLAEIELNLGRLDAAESAAQTAVRGWKGHPDRRRSVLDDITFATIHVRAGEPDGLQLAHGAVTAVAHLRSQRARDRLTPLITTLESRPSSDHRELARMARKVASIRV